jgi:transcriptional regulator with XRE-family HTH domain
VTIADTARRRPGPTGPSGSVGAQLRAWRERRRLSQLELSIDAEISTRHLSFVETGRSRPSREMVLHLAERLDVPLRERNHLLLAAGYAPAYAEHALHESALAPVANAVRQVLAGHEPYPAVVLNARGDLLDGNASAAMFLTGLPGHLLAPPANVLRISLHPEGLAPRIVNLPVWRRHLLDRLRRQIAQSADPTLSELYDELVGYPGSEDAGEPDPGAAVAIPLRYRHDGVELSFVSIVATFGAPLDVTVAELAIEAFYPADEPTAAFLRSSSSG